MSWRHAITKAMLPAEILGQPLLVVIALAGLVAVSPGGWGQPLTTPATALEDYVNAPDPTYHFSVEQRIAGPGFTQYTVRTQSQTWNPQGGIFTPPDFIPTPTRPNPTVWEHGLAIIVPDNVQHATGLLLITGRSNDGELVGAEEVLAAILFALKTNSVVAVLFQVPNQPLQFFDEQFNHIEDQLVAYTWDKAMESGDYSWPAHLPMVKSAVRAMDTVQQLGEQDLIPSVADFVVTGFSKRGAATWLTAVVDRRVRAIAPGVFDILNFSPQATHHLATYGCVSRAAHDYVDYQIVQRLGTPDGEALRQVVDPYSYRERLEAVPKLLLNASGDRFYTSDSARFYWNDLLGEKHLRYVPNSDHDFGTAPALANALENLLAWYRAVLSGRPRPTVSWFLHESGALVVSTSPPAYFARLWRATNPNARDFRLQSIGAAWSSTLRFSFNGTFVVRVPPPPSGWTAYFLEVIHFGGLPQFYTTQVFITPGVLPFDVPLEQATVCPE